MRSVIAAAWCLCATRCAGLHLEQIGTSTLAAASAEEGQ
jgi:hypothetical protein